MQLQKFHAKLKFNKDRLTGLVRRYVNSGIELKVPDPEDVEQLGRSLVNLENLHLTHLGDLP